LKEKAMKFKLLYLALLLALPASVFAQDSLRIGKPGTNPIIFAEGSFGYSGGNTNGWTAIASLNYQYKNDLFTFRSLSLVHYSWGAIQAGFVIIPLPRRTENVDEFSILYGKRYIYDNKSISFSVGIGTIKDRKLIVDADNYYWTEERSIGVPFEFNIKWFKREKKPFRIYWIVPVGPPMAFGGSIGFKLSGTIAKTNYIGVGMTYSYGWHKNY
jgi:hypothetical protein